MIFRPHILSSLLFLSLTVTFATAEELPIPPDAAVEETFPVSGNITIKLDSGEVVSGRLISPTKIQANVLGSSLSVPIESILGLRLPHEGIENAVVILKNRDQLTGHVEIDDVKLALPYGELKVNKVHLREVLSSQNLRWSKITTPNAVRWGIYGATQPVVNDKPIPSAPAGAAKQSSVKKPGVKAPMAKPVVNPQPAPEAGKLTSATNRIYIDFEGGK